MSAEATLTQITESAGYLLKLTEAEQPIAEREVKMLQTAFDFVLSSNAELGRTKKATQCRNVLKRLTDYTRHTAATFTGDTEEVTPLGFDKHGAPTQKATKYIEKTIEVIERSTKPKGKKSGTKGSTTSGHPTTHSSSGASRDGATTHHKKSGFSLYDATEGVAGHSGGEDEDEEQQQESSITTPLPAISPALSAASATTPRPGTYVSSPTILATAASGKKKKKAKRSLALQSPEHKPMSGRGTAAARSISPMAHSDTTDNDYAADASLAEMAAQYTDVDVEEERAIMAKHRERMLGKGKANGGGKNFFFPLLDKVVPSSKKKAAAVSTNASFAKAASSSNLKASSASPTGKQRQSQHNSASSSKNRGANNNKHQKQKEQPRSDQSGVKWRWTNIPFRRRLQTLVVSGFTFFTGLPFFVAVFLILCLFKYALPFMLVYLTYIFIIFPRTHKHPLMGWPRWRQSWIFEQYRDYFPIRLIVPKATRKQLKPNENYFFIYHPHGIHGFGAISVFGSDVHNSGESMPGLKFHVQTLGMQFWAPFWREMVVWMGAGDASAKCIKRTLNAGGGHCPVLVVGGAEESLLSSPKSNVLCLMKRKGFVRIALENGKPLVPVFAFGENDVYYNFAHHIPRLKSFLLKIQKKMKFALPIIVGRGYFNYSFGMLPHRRPINVVIGEPLVVPHIEKPSQEEIDHWHLKYVEALMVLYETHKGVYEPEGTLIIE